MKELDVQVINLAHHRFNLEVFYRVKKAGFKFLTKERSARFDWEGSKGQHIGNACIDLEEEGLITRDKI